MLRRIFTLITALLLVAAVTAPVARAEPYRLRPVVFVHGFSGSGGQFETQARRLASNGYPVGHIETHEYDSTFVNNTQEQIFTALDQRVAALVARTGADRVDLLAHSLGTRLMQTYLNSSPDRAAKVAHYVNLDGAPAAAPPGGVPTLAVWGEGPAERQIVGAKNVYLPGQSHTQTVTSAETFTEAFTFFNGRAPRTTVIVPELFITLSGRAVLFPTNLGASGARLEVWKVDPRTGARRERRPVATHQIGADGSWGPIRAEGDAHYEFAVIWSDQSVHHHYFQPFRRTDTLVRLLTSRPGEGLAAQTEVGPDHTNLVVNRQKEWWGGEGDSLKASGVELLNAANSPRSKRTIGIFTFDAGKDRVTDLAAPIPAFFAQPFITGLDLFVPATGRPLALTTRPRDGNGRVDAVVVPALRSDVHRISVQFNDY